MLQLSEEDENTRLLYELLRADQNYDMIFRPIRVGDQQACLYFINGFVKVADTIYEVQNREDVENLLKRIIDLEVGYVSISQ